MPLGICVVLGREHRPGPGERRLLAALADDARFNVDCVTEAPRPATTISATVRAAFAIERLLFREPDQAPTAVPDMTPFDVARQGRYDVVVDFSYGEAALALAETAREGVWRLTAFAPAAGLTQPRDRAPFNQVRLLRHRDGAGAETRVETLATARYNTKFLATRNVSFIREKSVQMVIQALARLALTGSAVRGDIAPPLGEVRGFAARDLPGYLVRTVSELAIRIWNEIGERTGRRPGMFVVRLGSGDPLAFDPATSIDLEAPPGTFWADPFLFEDASALYLFYEQYDYATRRGNLGVGRIEGDTIVPLGTALETPYHLSFPFVFRWNDEILMIPETHEVGRIEVWRATEFPTRWEKAAVAFEGVAAADTVVFEKDGQWWMFTNICNDSHQDFAAELHLFRIDSPMLNEIVPHPLNPVVIDTRTARGGGRVFAHEGRLFRASQDNSHATYGYGLNLMEITRLDDTGYEERPLRHIVADFADGIMACHHTDAAAGRFVIDVRLQAMGGPKLRRRKREQPALQEQGHQPDPGQRHRAQAE